MSPGSATSFTGSYEWSEGGSWVKLFIMTEIIIFIREIEAQMPFRKSA